MTQASPSGRATSGTLLAGVPVEVNNMPKQRGRGSESTADMDDSGLRPDAESADEGGKTNSGEEEQGEFDPSSRGDESGEVY
jgi:hypothetical protein